MDRRTALGRSQTFSSHESTFTRNSLGNKLPACTREDTQLPAGDGVNAHARLPFGDNGLTRIEAKLKLI